MELLWKNLTLNEDWLQVRFAFHSADFCSLQEESELGVRSFVCGTESLKCPPCHHSQGTCASPSSGAAAHRGWETLSLSSLCVTCSCHLPAVSAPEHSSTGGNIISLELLSPVSWLELQFWGSSTEQPSSIGLGSWGWAEHRFGTGHLQSSAQVEMLPNFCRVTAPPSVLGSVLGSTTQCAALPAPGSTELFWRAESREKTAHRAF